MAPNIIQRASKYEAEFEITNKQYDADTYQGWIYLPFGVVLRGDDPRQGKRLRLAGIDAFEVKKVRGASAADVVKGKEARDRIREMMPVGSRIRFESHKIEKFGRILATVWCPIPDNLSVIDHPLGVSGVDLMSFGSDDPTHFNVNQWLVQTGRAKPYMQDQL